MNISMKYGETKVAFQLTDHQVKRTLEIADTPILENPAEAIRQALRSPIDSPPLRKIVQPGQKITIIVNDSTRVANTDFFLPIILEELNDAGVLDDHISILFALGTHRPMTQEEMTAEVGVSVASRIKMYNSNSKEDDQFIFMGTTSRETPVWFHKIAVQADHIICTGSIVHHFFSGFGGGRKAIFPGVSRYDTIRANHSLMLDPNAILGRLAGNPVYDDQMEGIQMHPPSFLLNVVLNAQKEFLAIYAGNYHTAHLEACKFVDQVYGAEIDKPADLVIASCGGYPKDINIYQVQKTMDNAWWAVREGGVVILLAECREGSGSALYESLMEKHRTPEEVEKVVRADFQIGAHKAYAVTRLMKKATFILVSSLTQELAEKLLFTPAKSIEEALEIATEKIGDSPSIILMPQGSLTVPRTK